MNDGLVFPWSSTSDNELDTRIYVVQQGVSGPLKIGQTRRDLSQRLIDLQTGNAERLYPRVLWIAPRYMEHQLLAWTKPHRRIGEWVRFSPDIALEIINNMADAGFEPDVLDPRWRALVNEYWDYYWLETGAQWIMERKKRAFAEGRTYEPPTPSIGPDGRMHFTLRRRRADP